MVFSTLRPELTKRERDRISKLARWGRKNIGAEKWRAHVLVLTAQALFSDWAPPNCWKDVGGKYSEFAQNWRDHFNGLTDICDATQQLHLGMVTPMEVSPRLKP